MLNQAVGQGLKPGFDNLYLDMNGIVHNCSHPEGADLSKPLDEGAMFKDIAAYISRLFDIIRPRKLFYMAIDGIDVGVLLC